MVMPATVGLALSVTLAPDGMIAVSAAVGGACPPQVAASLQRPDCRAVITARRLRDSSGSTSGRTVRAFARRDRWRWPEPCRLIVDCTAERRRFQVQRMAASAGCEENYPGQNSIRPTRMIADSSWSH